MVQGRDNDRELHVAAPDHAPSHPVLYRYPRPSTLPLAWLGSLAHEPPCPRHLQWTRSVTLLSAVPGIKPIYFLPDDNFAEEVLIPCLAAAGSFDCMVGYFSSRSFAQLAPGLATFLEDPRRTLRLIVSPLLTQADRQAIERGLKSENQIVEDSLAALLTSPEGIVRHTLRCLSYLIAHKRLQIRIALMKHAQFHLKAWILTQDCRRLAAHGSSNFTEAGLIRNYEQITVSRSWIDDNQARIVTSLQDKFTTLWNNREKSCRIYNLPDAVERRILQDYPVDRPPTEQEYRDLANDYDRPDDTTQNAIRATAREDYNDFAIPSYLRYREGDYAHQGSAVDAWCARGFRGILEMATGSGKTIAAMVAAKYLHQEHSPLLIVIAAPYLPLIAQWCEEVRPFGIVPVDITAVRGSAGRRKLIAKARRRLRHGRSDVEVLIGTHETLCDPDFIQAVDDDRLEKLLIADEVHNLGREAFAAQPPECFNHRLGLSATPIRQYDPGGTAFLQNYFGDIAFRFSLEQAIGICLVPYDYFVHTVYLSERETSLWLDLTDKIKRLASWNREQERSDYIEKLLRDRRLVLEAAENKTEVLGNLLDEAGPRNLRHTLVYATDKNPEQLDAVNQLLKQRDVLFHQLTAEETRDRNGVRKILGSFQSGAVQVLTAKRVLDEGVNVPEITTAYILASTTVERQWIQRRGRILRKCGAVNKRYATLHDFLVLPPSLGDAEDRDARAMVKQELSRVAEFASIARNAGKADGASATTHKVVKEYFAGGMEMGEPWL